MKPYKILIFLASILLTLGAVCTLWGGTTVSLGPMDIRIPDLSLFKSVSSERISAEDLLEESSKTMSIEAIADTIQNTPDEPSDTLKFYFAFMSENNARLYLPGGDTCISVLHPLFSALDNASENPVHIIHYGDSQVEGDRITGFLRARFQEQYGGNGPGLLPLVQNIGAMSVGQSLNEDLVSYMAGGMLGQRASHKGYGAMAQFAHIDSDSDDPLSLIINAKKVAGFKRIQVFADNIEDSLSVKLNGNTQYLSGGPDLQSLTWRLKKDAKRLNVNFTGEADILGLYIDADTGVTVTNIPLRGSDGTFFTRIQKKEFSEMLTALNTRLVLLEFGGNALPMMKDSVKIAKYGTSFAKQIKFIQSACPDATVIVIGPADMNTKVNGVLTTHPFLEPLIEQLKQSTLECGAIYWDMYRAMGGRNSMRVWAEHQPAWAGTDYIHFTRKGADQIADLLWHSLLIYRDYWRLTTNAGMDK